MRRPAPRRPLDDGHRPTAAGQARLLALRRRALRRGDELPAAAAAAALDASLPRDVLRERVAHPRRLHPADPVAHRHLDGRHRLCDRGRTRHPGTRPRHDRADRLARGQPRHSAARGRLLPVRGAAARLGGYGSRPPHDVGRVGHQRAAGFAARSLRALGDAPVLLLRRRGRGPRDDAGDERRGGALRAAARPRRAGGRVRAVPRGARHHVLGERRAHPHPARRAAPARNGHLLLPPRHAHAVPPGAADALCPQSEHAGEPRRPAGGATVAAGGLQPPPLHRHQPAQPRRRDALHAARNRLRRVHRQHGVHCHRGGAVVRRRGGGARADHAGRHGLVHPVHQHAVPSHRGARRAVQRVVPRHGER